MQKKGWDAAMLGENTYRAQALQIKITVGTLFSTQYTKTIVAIELFLRHTIKASKRSNERKKRIRLLIFIRM